MATLIQHGRDLGEIHATFFKCISWQVEETLDAINCPYHYVCDKTYPAKNYPPSVDILVLLFTTASYLVTLVIVIMDIIMNSSGRGGRVSFLGQSKRFLLPSGPISLPLIILTFAKGTQINTIFPLSCTGPAILLLVLISALSSDNVGADDKDIKYTFFAASTVSGIMHASLYLDSVVLPYYTGFDALMSSTFSGKLLAVKVLMERFSWILITVDCVYLTANSPPERVVLRVAAFGGILLLIFLHVLKEACSQIYTMANLAKKLRWVSTSLQTV